MDIIPIWKDLFYEESGVSLPLEYRILSGEDYAQEIFHGRAVPDPDGTVRINLNKQCASYLDSTLFPELVASALTSDALIPMNASRQFKLEIYAPVARTWGESLEWVFYNDTSYSENTSPNGDEVVTACSEPINGHAAPGQLLSYTCLVPTGEETRTVCYSTNGRNAYLYILSDVEEIPPFNTTFIVRYDTDCNGQVKYELLSSATVDGEYSFVSSGTTTSLTEASVFIEGNHNPTPVYYKIVISASDSDNPDLWLVSDSIYFKQGMGYGSYAYVELFGKWSGRYMIEEEAVFNNTYRRFTALAPVYETEGWVRQGISGNFITPIPYLNYSSKAAPGNYHPSPSPFPQTWEMTMWFGVDSGTSGDITAAKRIAIDNGISITSYSSLTGGDIDAGVVWYGPNIVIK